MIEITPTNAIDRYASIGWRVVRASINGLPHGIALASFDPPRNHTNTWSAHCALSRIACIAIDDTAQLPDARSLSDQRCCILRLSRGCTHYIFRAPREPIGDSRELGDGIYLYVGEACIAVPPSRDEIDGSTYIWRVSPFELRPHRMDVLPVWARAA